VVRARIFAGVGLLLVILACYMAGADSLACRRNGDRVDCRVARSRLLGAVTVEQLVVPDVIDAWVRTSTTSQQTYRSGRGSNAQHTSSNDTLILHTRDNRDVATLGGDQSASYADQVVAIVKATGAAQAAADSGPGGIPASRMSSRASKCRTATSRSRLSAPGWARSLRSSGSWQ
jgi:hypothetical protein